MTAEEGWAGVEEVAAHLRVAKEPIYRWIESKSFPAHRVGRLLRFKLSEVDGWVKNSGGSSSSSGVPGKRMTSNPAARRLNSKKGRRGNR